MEVKKAAILEKAFSKRLSSTVTAFKLLVDNYAVAEAIIIGTIHRTIYNDFLYFCITKSCKSLMSVELLLKNNLPEDALVLLRTFYENYLSLSFLLYNPDRIDNFVEQKIRVYVGDYKHPKTNRGYVDYKRIIKEDGEIVRYGFSAKELSRATRHKSDIVTFDYFYTFLSELVHPHFISSGNYRHDAKYTYADASNNLQTYFCATYFSTKLIYEWFAYEDIEKRELRYFKNEMKKNCKLMQKAIFQGMFENDDKTYLEAIQSMVKEIEEYVK